MHAITVFFYRFPADLSQLGTAAWRSNAIPTPPATMSLYSGDLVFRRVSF